MSLKRVKSLEFLNSCSFSGGRLLQASRDMRASSLRSVLSCSLSRLFFIVNSSCSGCSIGCSSFFSALPNQRENHDRFGSSS